ncbi:MAG: CCA tRNA nucleotidyltransferase [Anaerovoracaceae bacterium]
MIKLHKDVNKIFKTFEAAGHKIYAVGGCVRDDLLGLQPLDWDLATDASLEEMLALFPKAKIIREDLSVIRIDKTLEGDEEGAIIDIARFRIEEDYSDYRHPDKIEFTKDIRKDLARRDFTMNAIADNPKNTVVDPFAGLLDIREKLIRAVGDPLTRFKEDPIRMLRAVRFAAELDFDIQKETYEAMLEAAPLLSKVSVDLIREEFGSIIEAEHAGKGLRILAGADLMPAIIGENLSNNLSRWQKEQFSILADNIHKTKQNRARRLGLFYACFDGKKGEEAIRILNYDARTEQHLVDAMYLLHKLHFLKTPEEFKKFLVKYTIERYDYLHNLTKAHRLVYELQENKIASRDYMMQEMKREGEAIFIEDLAINGNDLIENNLADGERIGRILDYLLTEVHRNPKYNNKETLLRYARKYGKYPFWMNIRKIKWLR